MITEFQNDLQEFYSLVEFCNPGVLGNLLYEYYRCTCICYDAFLLMHTGSYSAFKKVYEEPIVFSRQPAATGEEKDIGERRANEVKC